MNKIIPLLLVLFVGEILDLSQYLGHILVETVKPLSVARMAYLFV
ncbi:hypothetical protein [Enterococcus faecium]